MICLYKSPKPTDLSILFLLSSSLFCSTTLTESRPLSSPRYHRVLAGLLCHLAPPSKLSTAMQPHHSPHFPLQFHTFQSTEAVILSDSQISSLIDLSQPLHLSPCHFPSYLFSSFFLLNPKQKTKALYKSHGTQI